MKTAWCVVAVLTIAYLLVLPQPVAHAGLLRDDAVTFRQEGYELQQRGDLEGAVGAYQKATGLDPTYATPHNDLGVVHEDLGDFDAAERAYQQAVAIDPKYLSAHTNLALLYERLGQREKAIFHWLKRYQLGDPYDPWTVHAEQRLLALGVLKSYPGLKSRIFTRRRAVERELEANRLSLQEFRAMTEQEWAPKAKSSR
jgi:tetratricopeptide (TPR) repeat protein